MAFPSGQGTHRGRLSLGELVFPPSGCILGGTFSYWKSSHPLLKADTRIPFPEWNSWVETWAVSAHPETAHLDLFLPTGSPSAAITVRFSPILSSTGFWGEADFTSAFWVESLSCLFSGFAVKARILLKIFHGMINFSVAFSWSFSCHLFSALIITCQLVLCTPHHSPFPSRGDVCLYAESTSPHSPGLWWRPC